MNKATFGVIAWLLARGADGVYELVEQASALGSAGVLVTVSFALFTNMGGARAAAATLVTGVVVYLLSAFIGAQTPFLLSLLACVIAYPLVSRAEQWGQGKQSVTATH